MRPPVAWRTFLTILLLAAVVIACKSHSTPAPDNTVVPTTVETFTSETLMQYRGKIVLLNFWAIWCGPCRLEMPDLEAVYQEYGERGVVVVGVNVTESAAEILAYAQKLNLTFPLLRDAEAHGTKTYSIRALPTTLFLDREGQVQYRQLGLMKKDSVVERVESLLH
ncbi:MAG: TlpA family protein disulfide reductase [Chloroflexi bacterium]|nr:TlpA family protein disulfide reductase [Chloroflexota bacterium]